MNFLLTFVRCTSEGILKFLLVLKPPAIWLKKNVQVHPFLTFY